MITSSSDEKLAKIKGLSRASTSVLGVNYKTHPNWAKEAKKLTEGRGVDIVVKNLGTTTIEESLDALCNFGGPVALVGFLGRFGDGKNHPDIMRPLLSNGVKLQ